MYGHALVPLDGSDIAEAILPLHREGACFRPVLEILMVETRESRHVDPGTG